MPNLKELKPLQKENSRLKRMFVDLSLNYRILKDIIEKTLKRCERKELVKEEEMEQKACTAGLL